MITIDPEFRDLLPPLSTEESSALEQSILTNGLRDPLTVWNDILIDGHNRYKICKKYNLDYNIVEMDFPSKEAVKDWIDSNQLGRRNLTPDAFRLALGRLYNRRKISFAQAGSRCQSDNGSGRTSEELAKSHGVSPRTVIRASKFAEQVESDPILKQAIKDRQPVNNIIKKMRVEKSQQATAERHAVSRSTNSKIELHHGDFREVASNIPDESIDLILTDPPYPEEFRHLWKDLGVVAERVLKPSGFLVAYSGQHGLPQILNSLQESGLQYYWMAALKHTRHAQRFERSMMNAQKPILIYQKPPTKKQDGWLVDLVSGSGQEKTHHEWQQDLQSAETLLDAFSKPGDLVLDPFLGGGTTAAACKIYGRDCIGIEIEEDSYQRCRERLDSL